MDSEDNTLISLANLYILIIKYIIKNTTDDDITEDDIIYSFSDNSDQDEIPDYPTGTNFTDINVITNKTLAKNNNFNQLLIDTYHTIKPHIQHTNTTTTTHINNNNSVAKLSSAARHPETKNYICKINTNTNNNNKTPTEINANKIIALVKQLNVTQATLEQLFKYANQAQVNNALAASWAIAKIIDTEDKTHIFNLINTHIKSTSSTSSTKSASANASASPTSTNDNKPNILKSADIPHAIAYLKDKQFTYKGYTNTKGTYIGPPNGTVTNIEHIMSIIKDLPFQTIKAIINRIIKDN